MRVSLNFADLKCPKCGYALAGLPTRTCPECGFNFDPVVLKWRIAHARRRRWLHSAAVIAFAMYAPFSWVLWIDEPWNSQRWLWIRIWPILPGISPTALINSAAHVRMSDGVMFLLMGAITLAALLQFSWLGSRGKRWLVITATIVFALSCCNAWVGYQLYRL